MAALKCWSSRALNTRHFPPPLSFLQQSLALHEAGCVRSESSVDRNSDARRGTFHTVHSWANWSKFLFLHPNSHPLVPAALLTTHPLSQQDRFLQSLPRGWERGSWGRRRGLTENLSHASHVGDAGTMQLSLRQPTGMEGLNLFWTFLSLEKSGYKQLLGATAASLFFLWTFFWSRTTRPFHLLSGVLAFAGFYLRLQKHAAFRWMLNKLKCTITYKLPSDGCWLQ